MTSPRLPPTTIPFSDGDVSSLLWDGDAATARARELARLATPAPPAKTDTDADADADTKAMLPVKSVAEQIAEAKQRAKDVALAGGMGRMPMLGEKTEAEEEMQEMEEEMEDMAMDLERPYYDSEDDDDYDSEDNLPEDDDDVMVSEYSDGSLDPEEEVWAKYDDEDESWGKWADVDAMEKQMSDADRVDDGDLAVRWAAALDKLKATKGKRPWYRKGVVEQDVDMMDE
ncbi:hypothetical protein K504DRAFT_463939 [Pleomassaria siparia CBS 279.74]|uniref:Uncharacterized protein n=1 Tax=Pleomassaria siparia CBS 279.74 TaxID=1314801 RepID=A0A6G1JQU9_9PLEO|nr:hypothetical protein K504DRAFT_463939 [Pleomassaria siparia CBS 279.74]